MEERFEKIKQTLKENEDKEVKDKIVEDIKVSYKIFNYDFAELQNFAENFNNSKETNRAWRMDCCDSLSELSKETLKLLNNYILNIWTTSALAIGIPLLVFYLSYKKASAFYSLEGGTEKGATVIEDESKFYGFFRFWPNF